MPAVLQSLCGKRCCTASGIRYCLCRENVSGTTTSRRLPSNSVHVPRCSHPTTLTHSIDPALQLISPSPSPPPPQGHGHTISPSKIQEHVSPKMPHLLRIKLLAGSLPRSSPCTAWTPPKTSWRRGGMAVFCFGTNEMHHRAAKLNPWRNLETPTSRKLPRWPPRGKPIIHSSLMHMPECAPPQSKVL